MTLTVHDQIDQGSPEWHDQRRGIVTASVVGKLLTPTGKVADNDTARGLTALLVAERITGHTEDTFINDDMMRGVMHEPLARDRYAQTVTEPVTEVGFMRRDEPGWTLGYSPDGLVGDHGLIEVKCPRAKTHVTTILAGQVPAYYMAQCQAGLLVSGRRWLDFISFCAGLPLWVKRVHPDPVWHAAITAAATQFETTAAEMVATYNARTEGLPATERIEMEITI